MKKLLLILICFVCLPLFVQVSNATDKITGPWLWMIAPCEPGKGGSASTDLDQLSKASGGAVTEEKVAKNGAKAGDKVGNLKWKEGTISPTGGDNVTEVVTRIGLGAGDIDDHSAYALITVKTEKAWNKATMRVGSDDSIKVWLNGEVVWKNAVDRGASDFIDEFKVNLKAGDNLLLVKVSERGGGWSMFAGINADFEAGGKRYKWGEEPPGPGAKITGPWLWMTAPSPQCGASGTNTDWLSQASKGKVTEEDIASKGTEEGDKVGDLEWTEGIISPTGGDNVNELITRIGLGKGDVNNTFSYAYINVSCPSARKTWMYTGSDDSIKVWLNGEVVWTNAIDRGASDYLEWFPVELYKGNNPLLVKVGECGGGWAMFVGFSSKDTDLKFNLNLPGPGHAVEPTGKIPVTWGKIKGSH